jgi:hypothetical protein
MTPKRRPVQRRACRAEAGRSSGSTIVFIAAGRRCRKRASATFPVTGWRARSRHEPDAEHRHRRCVRPEVDHLAVGLCVPDQRTLGALDCQHVAADLRFHLLALLLTEGRLVVGDFIEPGVDLRQHLFLEQPAHDPKCIDRLAKGQRRRVDAAHQ